MVLLSPLELSQMCTLSPVSVEIDMTSGKKVTFQQRIVLFVCYSFYGIKKMVMGGIKFFQWCSLCI